MGLENYIMKMEAPTKGTGKTEKLKGMVNFTINQVT